jgi:hypothetical protein
VIGDMAIDTKRPMPEPKNSVQASRSRSLFLASVSWAAQEVCLKHDHSSARHRRHCIRVRRDRTFQVEKVARLGRPVIASSGCG